MPRNFLNKDDEQNPMRSLQSMRLSPTIFLGLGGTGSYSVANVKRLYLKTFEGYREEGQRSPIPTGIQFLGFDSSKYDRPDVLISGSEWLNMSFKVTATSMKVMKGNSYFRKWIPDVSLWDYSSGAGGLRTLGKMLFANNITLFDNHFGAAMKNASQYHNLDDGQATVYVFAGLAGGTGAGALLEACFYIRQNYPGAQIIGILGVVGGEIGKPNDIKKNATVGCYAALREINAFQDGRALTGEYAQGTVFEFPKGGHHGVYAPPFDHVFLVGEKNDRGVHNLTSAKSLTAFMARTAFMLSAYPAETDEGQRSFQSEMCDHLAMRDKNAAGALATYLVPGFGQLRLPRVLAADYFTCTLGGTVVSALRGGGAYGEDRFTTFCAGHKLGLGSLSGDVGYDKSGTPIVPNSWMETIRPDMENSKYRYSTPGKTKILSYGKGMGTTYLKGLLQEMAPTATDLHEKLTDAIMDEAVKCMKSPRLRLAGAQDFLRKINAHIANETAVEWKKKEREKLEGLRVITKNWDAFKKLIIDVCTDSGPFDKVKDRINLNRAIAMYVDFLETYQSSVQEWARYEKANEILSRVARFAEETADRMELLSRTLGTVAAFFDDEKSNRATRLRDIDGAAAEDVVRINGFNLLDAAWRKSYLEDERRSPDTLLNTMCSGNWNPGLWLDWLGGNQVRERIVQDVYDRIEAAETADILTISIPDIFKESREEAAKSLSRLLMEKVSPQLGLSEMQSSFDDPAFIGFIGNVEGEFIDESLSKAEGLLSLSKAIAYEDDTICYLKIATGVPLPGCDPLRIKFSPRYNSWLADIRSQEKRAYEYEWGLHHGFAGVEAWPDPIEFAMEMDDVTMHIGRSLAISIMLDPKRFGPAGLNDDYLHLLTTSAVRAMGKQSRNPKEKRLGLFKIGRSNFWLSPFFDPLQSKYMEKEDKNGNKEKLYVFEDVEAPAALGGTITAARQAILESDIYKSTVSEWTHWFEDKVSNFFNDQQLAEALELAADEITVMKSRQPTESDDYRLWGAILRDVRTTWKDRLL